LQEARHHGTGAPIAALARHRTDQWVAVGGEGESPVYPSLDPNLLQAGIAFKAEGQFVFDPVGLFLE
jgi:hypothetical protein